MIKQLWRSLVHGQKQRQEHGLLWPRPRPCLAVLQLARAFDAGVVRASAATGDNLPVPRRELGAGAAAMALNLREPR